MIDRDSFSQGACAGLPFSHDPLENPRGEGGKPQCKWHRIYMLIMLMPGYLRVLSVHVHPSRMILWLLMSWLLGCWWQQPRQILRRAFDQEVWSAMEAGPISSPWVLFCSCLNFPPSISTSNPMCDLGQIMSLACTSVSWNECFEFYDISRQFLF